MRLLPSDTPLLILIVTLRYKWCLLRSSLGSEVNKPLGHQWRPFLVLCVVSRIASRLGLTLIYLLLDGFLNILLLVILKLPLTLVVLVPPPELIVILEVPKR